MSFSYCVQAAGYNQASQIMCVDQNVALKELQVLVNSCNATEKLMSACSGLAKTGKTISYGVCGNRVVCNLLYHDPINTCFNNALNATISCASPTTSPATNSSLPLTLSLSLIGATAAVGVAFLCWKYRSKISELWTRCCNNGYEKL